MITYALSVVSGCIHKPFMKLQIGTDSVTILCAPIRGFIKAANQIGLEAALEEARPIEHEMLAFLYEEFKDEL